MLFMPVWIVDTRLTCSSRVIVVKYSFTIICGKYCNVWSYFLHVVLSYDVVGSWLQLDNVHKRCLSLKTLKLDIYKSSFLEFQALYWLLHLFPAGNYMLEINNRNTRTRCEVCSKLVIDTPERCLNCLLWAGKCRLGSKSPDTLWRMKILNLIFTLSPSSYPSIWKPQ